MRMIRWYDTDQATDTSTELLNSGPVTGPSDAPSVPSLTWWKSVRRCLELVRAAMDTW